MKSINLKVFHREGSKKQYECTYEGSALYEENEYLLYQDDQSVTKVLWNQKESQMTIFRQSEIKTLLKLNLGNWGTIIVQSDFGEMQLKNKTKIIQITQEQWIAEYDVINGNERMNNRFIWIMKENKNEQS